MTASFSIDCPIEMKVAIQGELGSFSHEATLTLVPDAEMVPCATAEQVLYALDNSAADAAVIPVENSLAGSVIDFYNLFFQHEFAIERELVLRIRHNLIAPAGAEFGSIRQAFSHPVALAQCRRFFGANPQLEAMPYYDTAGSVRYVVERNSREIAAIASKHAAAHYGARILQEGIEDGRESYTRFWLVRRQSVDQSAPTKLSLAFLLENRPGALLGALGVFASRNLNLTQIESRPVATRPWEYMFYADVSIHSNAEADAVLHDLKNICSIVRELGRYCASERASN